MNVCLINLPYSNVYRLVKTAQGRTPPITLAYLAASIREAGHQVSIIDAHNLSIGTGEGEIRKILPIDTDVIGISCLTPSYYNGLKVLESVKHIKPSCITIMGGPHITAIPQEVLREAKDLDFGILGEGEETFIELLDVLSDGIYTSQELRQVKGIAFKDKQEIIITPRRDLIDNLDRLPIPAYDLLNMEMYEQKPHHVWANKEIPLKPYTNIFTSRGCPYECTFCASNIIWGKKARFKSSGYVLKEIDILVKRFGIKSLYFGDDTFLLKKDRAQEILRRIIDRKYDLNFCCMARVDEVDEELLHLLKQANCHLIRFGVESCSQKILDAMKKGYTLDKIRSAFTMCKKVGIAASASVIIGYPGETKETFSETLKILKEIDPVGCEFFIALPLIGTELYELARKKNYLIEQDWSTWTLLPDKPLIETEYLKAHELLALRRRALISFYFRPIKIWQIFSRIRSLADIRYYLGGLYAMLGLVNPFRLKS